MNAMPAFCMWTLLEALPSGLSTFTPSTKALGYNPRSARNVRNSRVLT